MNHRPEYINILHRASFGHGDSSEIQIDSSELLQSEIMLP